MSDRHEQELYERPRPRSDKFVCATCLEDQALQDFANQHGEARECAYCGHTPTTLSVVPLDDVIEAMRKVIEEEWTDPEGQRPLIAADEDDCFPEWLKVLDNGELLSDEVGFGLSNDKLIEDIIDGFGHHEWCPLNWQLLSPTKRWSYGWEKFERVIKHERRYTFWYSDDDEESPGHPDHLPPSQMLNELQAVINSAKMVMELPVGTAMWRVRCHEENKSLTELDDFTPPPIKLATQPNRMSPAGVPMFYGACDFDTAVEEVVDPKDFGGKKLVSGCQFANLTPLNLLDLTAIPTMPSYFAPEGPFNRHIIAFLQKFTKALVKPIDRDGEPHIEYVPTQVFTEFVRHVMKGPQSIPIHGIKYPSSKNNRICYVIFANKEDCLPATGYRSRPQVLNFVDGSIKTAPVPAMNTAQIEAAFKQALQTL